MIAQPQRLEDAVRANGEFDVHVRCSRCGAPLGRYLATDDVPGGRLMLLEIWQGSALATPRWTREEARNNSGSVPGPRTQPGLYFESFGGREYLRKRCTCPANEKRPVGDLGALWVTVGADGAATLVF